MTGRRLNVDEHFMRENAHLRAQLVKALAEVECLRARLKRLDREGIPVPGGVIYRLDDGSGWVIADAGGWLPGVYADEAAARAALAGHGANG